VGIVLAWDFPKQPNFDNTTMNQRQTHSFLSHRAKAWMRRYTSTVSHRFHLWLCAGLLVFSFSLTASSQSPAPSRPAVSEKTTPASNSPKTPLATAADGVVALERHGRLLGLGFVLTGDGRIVSTLSTLGDGNQIDARYADGSVVDVKIGHTDRAWNLALLVPQVGRWETGLSASTADPFAEGTRVRTFAKRGRTVSVASVVLRGRTEMLGGDGELLRDAIEIATPIPATDQGAPLVDEQGKVLGVVSSACKPTEGQSTAPCRPTAYGVPIGALRQFLRNAPLNAMPPSPWLGIQGVGATTTIGGVRVVHVHPDSPAAAMQLQAGPPGQGNDIIVAVDGVPVHSAEMLAEQVRAKAVGAEIQLIVLRGGIFHVLRTALTAPPSTSSGPKTAR
jgi:serine protease Do